MRISRSGKNIFDFGISGAAYHCSIDNWNDNRMACTIDGHDHVLYVSEDKGNLGYVSTGGFLFAMQREDLLTETVSEASFDSAGNEGGHITSPMPGKVTKINTKPGEEVKKGQVLFIIEAMKMENLITAPRNGTVEKVNVKPGQMVETSTVLVDLEKK